MLDKFEKTFSVITGILTILIAWKVFVVGQSQFEANLKISEAQLKLSETERQQTIESGIPILAVSKSGFTPILENNYFEFLFKLENYGDRPAYNIRIQLYSIGYNREGKFEIIDKFNEIAANPITKNMQWDVGRNFSTSIKSKIFIYTIIEYSDVLLNKTKNDSYLFYIPENKYLKTKVEHGLMNASMAEKDSISLYIKTHPISSTTHPNPEQ